MVRLRHKLDYYFPEFANYFNSCMVRLRLLVTLFHLKLNVYFNSCMVRLRLFPVIRPIYTKSFQFLYGTIKTQENAGKPSSFNRISIPVWYD